MVEESFVMLKPDGFRLGAFKTVIEVFTANGLTISNCHIIRLDEELLRNHYSHLVDRSFFPDIVNYMMEGNVLTMTVTGIDAVAKVRKLIGCTDPLKAEEGTIRKIYGTNISRNCIHASDSVENAQIELERFDNYQKKYFKKLVK